MSFAEISKTIRIYNSQLASTFLNLNEKTLTNIPFFSVITLTFNSRNSINRTMESLRNQTYKNYEVIFQDAASTDDTVDLITFQLSQFEKASLISEPDKGIYDGLNKAIKRAKGQFICVLHSDDVFYSNDTLKIVASKLENTGYNIVYGDVLFVSKENTGRIIRKWKAGDLKKIKFWLGWMPPHTSLFVCKNLFTSSQPYRIDLTISADYDYILKIFLGEELSVLYLEKPITIMTVGGKSTLGLRASWQVLKEDYTVLKRHFGGWFFVPLILKRILKLPQYFVSAKSLKPYVKNHIR